METPRLPNIRVLSTPVANRILLSGIIPKLKRTYDDALKQPFAPRIDDILRRLP